jgi:hypothetical protein
MSIRPTTFGLALCIMLSCGPRCAHAQYRLVSRDVPSGLEVVRLPSPAEAEDNAFAETSEGPASAQGGAIDGWDEERTDSWDGTTTGEQPDYVNSWEPAGNGGTETGTPPTGTVANPALDNQLETLPPKQVTNDDLLQWHQGQGDFSSPYMQPTPFLHGCFFQYDHLSWVVTKPDVDVVGGSADDVVSRRLHSADRFDFGHWEEDRGWLASITFGEAFRTINTSLFTPAVPVTAADTLAMGEQIDFSTTELNRTFRFSPNWETFYGVRYEDYRSTSSLTGSGTFIGAASVSTITKNQIIGPQIGFRWDAAAYKFILNVEGRLLGGYNYQTISQGATVPGPVPLIARNIEDEEFAPVGELRVDVVLPINRVVAFRVGYTGILSSGLALYNPIVVYPAPGAGLANIDDEDEVYLSAFTAGIEINR